MRELRLAAAVLAAALLAGAAGGARASETMRSATNEIPRSVVGGAGGLDRTASATHRLDAAFGEEIGGSSVAASANRMAPGFVQLFSFPGTVTDFAVAAGVSDSSATFTWSTPGQDGGQGTLQEGSSYYIRVAPGDQPGTLTDFSLADIVISTQGAAVGSAVSSAAVALLANTTYWARIWTKDPAAGLSYASQISTFVTLAKPPVALPQTFLDVFQSSITVAWAALPQAPPDASSKTAEGYRLEISSTNFGALSPGGVVNSSETTSVLASTLTVDFPDLGATTNYYRVASLNWAGGKNYLSLGKLNFQIWQSTGLVGLGVLDAVNRSTVSISSMVVRNVGDLSATFILSAATATLPSSPWALSTSTGVETVTLQGVWNTGPPAPPPSAFATFLTTEPRASGGAGGAYAGDQTGVTVAPGAERTLWFRFWAPTSTVSTVPETVRVGVQAVYP